MVPKIGLAGAMPSEEPSCLARLFNAGCMSKVRRRKEAQHPAILRN